MANQVTPRKLKPLQDVVWPLQEAVCLFFSEFRISKSQESRVGQEVYGCLFYKKSREFVASDESQRLGDQSKRKLTSRKSERAR